MYHPPPQAGIRALPCCAQRLLGFRLWAAPMGSSSDHPFLHECFLIFSLCKHVQSCACLVTLLQVRSIDVVNSGRRDEKRAECNPAFAAQQQQWELAAGAVLLIAFTRCAARGDYRALNHRHARDRGVAKVLNQWLL